MKIVVFDMDETLGYFTEYGIFWDCLTSFVKQHGDAVEMNQCVFNELLDLFPEFLRPNIFSILSFLKAKKKSSCCHKMMIYTNNNGPKTWANLIIGYFEEKIRFPLIDQIIAAFKVNGCQVEPGRTTHDKTYPDLVRCTRIPPNAEICFLDDNYYPEMSHDNIYYINVKPYTHSIAFPEMLERFVDSHIGQTILSDCRAASNNNIAADLESPSLNDLQEAFAKNMRKQFKRFNYTVFPKSRAEQEIDNIVGKQIVAHLQTFFNKPKQNKTLKQKYLKRNKTLRKK